MFNTMFIDRLEGRNRAFLRKLFRSIRAEIENEERTNRPKAAITKPRHFPVLFLSDLHLGSQTCSANPLLEFLRASDADKIYLVGDVFDMWVKFHRQWKPIHTEVVMELVRKAQSGTKVIYTPGNHDDFFRRAYCQLSDNFEIVEDAIYQSPHGDRYLVVHGDVADNIPVDSELVSFIASRVEHFLRNMIKIRNFIGKLIGANPSEIVDKLVYLFNLKFSVKDRHHDFLLQLAKAQNCQGVICGHFHIPANIRNDQGHYINCGDWIDHCSAAFEDVAGDICVKSFAPRQFVNLHQELIPDYDEALSFQLNLARH